MTIEGYTIQIAGGESYTIEKGSLGEPGLSAYQLDVLYRDFEGTVIEWLESQKGADGADGQDGSDGAPGPNVISTATDVSFAGTGLVAFEAGKARAATDADYVTPDELTQAINDATDDLVSDSDLAAALSAYITAAMASTTYLALAGGTLTGNLVAPEYFVGGSGGPRLNTSGGTLRVRSNDNLSDGAFSSGAITCGSITTPNLILHDSSLNGQVTGVRVRNSNNGTGAQTRFELFNDASSGGNSGAAIFFCSSTFGGGFARVCGLWNFQAAGPVLIGAGNVERQRWHSGGNTSIGTSTDNGVDRLQVSGSVSISTLLRLGVYTVATLPNASANAGAFAQVTDSNSTTNGSTVAGGGSSRVPVFSNGTNWVIK